MVNKENDVRIQRPKKYGKSRFSHESAHLIQAGKIVLVHKAAMLSKIIFFSIKLLHANVPCVCYVKAKYQVNPSKAVIGADRPMYALL